jgi:hypothetical protein
MTNRRIIQSYRLRCQLGEQRVEVPIGSEPLSAAAGGEDSIRLLISSPVGERLTSRWFAVRPAGSQYLAEEEGRHVGTVSTHDGQVLWLVYDITFCALMRG